MGAPESDSPLSRKRVKKFPKRFRKKRKQAELLLNNLAQVLDACDKANVNIKLKHGIVYSKYGYVLPLSKGWTVRLLAGPDDGDDFEDF